MSCCMYHPWRALRRLADWTLVYAALPAGVLGSTDHHTRVITLAPGMTQAQRRSVVAHEIEHVRRGRPAPGWTTQDERRVQDATARRLIPLEDLIDALRWSRNWRELADELWVDEATVRDRLDGLRASEMDLIVQALDDRH